MTKVCERCGAEYDKRNRRFCSGSCRTAWINENVGNPAKSPEARAKISAARRGKPTTSGPLPKRQRENISKALRGRTHSEEAKRKISEGLKRSGVRPPANQHLIGAAHPNWKGGTSPARAADKTNPLYIAFHAAVLARDGYVCRDCGMKPTASARKRGSKDRLHVHHLRSWAEHPELRYDADNGVTLCHPCHMARHRGSPPPRGDGPRTLAELRSGQNEAA